MVIFMNKILVIVYIPSIEQEYEIFIPINKKIGTIKTKIIESVIELSDGNIKNVDNLRLYEKESASMLHNNIMVKNSGLKNGSKIILM